MLLLGMTCSGRDKGFIKYLKSENFNLKTKTQESAFSIKFPVLLPLWVWLRKFSKFICFVKEDSSLRVKNNFSTTSMSVFIIPVAKNLLAGSPHFHEWALFFNQRTSDPWQVDSRGLMFDAHTWTKEVWILPTKGREILLSGSRWGLLFRKLLWCCGLTHQWFCMGKGKCMQYELKGCEGRKCRTLYSTQYWKYLVRTCFNWFGCTAIPWKFWFTVAVTWISSSLRKEPWTGLLDVHSKPIPVLNWETIYVQKRKNSVNIVTSISWYILNEWI